jgi:hypothetical protein
MPDDLARRIERVEAECRSLRIAGRRWRLAALAAILGLIIFGACGSGTPEPTKIIEAELFRVRDASSKVLAEFGVHPNGGVALHLKDGKGITRVALSSKKDGSPSIILFDENDKMRINFSIGPEGEATESLMDGQERALAATRVFRDGSSNFILYGTDDQGKVGFEVYRDGTASLAIQQSPKSSRIAMRAAPDGTVVQEFVDRKQKRRVDTGISPDGSVNHTLLDTHENPKVMLNVLPDDSAGQVVGANDGDRFFVVIGKSGFMGVGVSEKDVIHPFYQSKR